MTGAVHRRSRRLRSVADSATSVSRYLAHEGRKLARLVRERRFGAAAGAAAELVTGRNPYYERRAAGDDRYRRLEVNGHRLLVDVEDSGISRTLLAYGVHEYRSTTAFERALERLKRAVDGPVTVLEIGANVGYFCSLEARVLGDRARILAVEPIPENVALLERNAALNGFEDRVTIDRLAFGGESATVEMQLSTHSNQHRVRPASSSPSATSGSSSAATAAADSSDRSRERANADENPPTTPTSNATAETIRVEQVTGREYLADRDVDPGSVNVVRLDVEGYEREVFEGMREVFAAPGPTLLYVELHPLELSPEATAEITALLEDESFEIVSAVRTDAAAGVPDERRWHGLECGVETVDDLRRAMATSDHSIEVVARK